MADGTLRARLPNGAVVAIKPDLSLATPNGSSSRHRLSAQWRDDIGHADVLDFTVSVAPAVFSEADPGARPERLEASNDTVDLMFKIRERPAVGLVFAHAGNIGTIDMLPRIVGAALPRMERYIERQARTQPVETAYFVLGGNLHAKQ
jgi:hypothetical protein